MFKEALESIIARTEGSLGALIMGTDGIHVERVLTDNGHAANIDVAAAEVTSLVRGAQRAGNEIGLGSLREFVMVHEAVVLIVRMLNAEYFFVLAIEPGGNIGRGRFELRKAELSYATEFAL